MAQQPSAAVEALLQRIVDTPTSSQEPLLSDIGSIEKALLDHVDAYLFSNLKWKLSDALSERSEAADYKITEDRLSLFEKFFAALFERYKSQSTSSAPISDDWRQLMMIFVPSFLFIWFSGQQQRIAESALLCVYNCEVARRSKLPLQSRKNRMLQLVEQTDVTSLKNVYGPGAGKPSASPSPVPGSTAPALTSGALAAHNKATSGKHNARLDAFRRDHLDLQLRSDVKHESFAKTIRIVLQVFHARLNRLSPAILQRFCRVVQLISASGMPYALPSHDDMLRGEASSRKQTIIIRSDVSAPVDPHSTDEAKKALVASPTQTIGKSAVDGAGPAEPTGGHPAEEIITEGTAEEGADHLHHAPRVIVKQKRRTAAELLHEALFGGDKRHPTPAAAPLKDAAASAKKDKSPATRIHVDPSVLVELINSLKYCVYRSSADSAGVAAKELAAPAYEALYAVHSRALYEQMETVLLISNSLLQHPLQ